MRHLTNQKKKCKSMVTCHRAHIKKLTSRPQAKGEVSSRGGKSLQKTYRSLKIRAKETERAFRSGPLSIIMGRLKPREVERLAQSDMISERVRTQPRSSNSQASALPTITQSLPSSLQDQHEK